MIVYKLTSPSGKSYIGITKNDIPTRFSQHVNQFNLDLKQGNKLTKLQQAFKKYGTECWQKEILIECDTPDEIFENEIKMIKEYDTLKNGYNIMPGGQFGWTDTPLSKEHKQKLSESRKQYFETDEGKEWKEELSKSFKENNPGKLRRNYTHSEETRKNISIGCKGVRRSEEYKEYCSKRTKLMWESGAFDHRAKPNLTEEQRKQRGDIWRGKPSHPNQKEGARKALSKKWLITFPDGHQEKIVNLTQFCKDNKLESSNIRNKSGSKKYYAKKLN